AVDIHRPSSSLRFRWAISGSWKLILPEHRNAPLAVVELYNLAADPHEARNLVHDHPEKVAELKTTIDGWWTPEG
ncbi:sulfatase, partial [Singulisphaera rosea]